MIRKLLLVSLLLGSSAAVAAPPAKFLNNAIQGDNSEIHLGHLISQHGSSQDVRSFGDTLVSDHTQARTQAAGVASQLGVHATDSIAPDARREYAKLQHMHGAAFDREARRFMIHAHQMAIMAFEAQAHGSDKATAELARSQLPKFREHLHMAQSLHE